jgi:membrane associated rhomboid family serine protease
MSSVDPLPPVGVKKWKYLFLGTRLPYAYKDWVIKDLSRPHRIRVLVLPLATFVVGYSVLSIFFGSADWWTLLGGVAGGAIGSEMHEKRQRDLSLDRQIKGWRKEGHNVHRVERPWRAVVPMDEQRFYTSRN